MRLKKLSKDNYLSVLVGPGDGLKLFNIHCGVHDGHLSFVLHHCRIRVIQIYRALSL